jgi:hypothetical protein
MNIVTEGVRFDPDESQPSGLEWLVANDDDVPIIAAQSVGPEVSGKAVGPKPPSVMVEKRK